MVSHSQALHQDETTERKIQKLPFKRSQKKILIVEDEADVRNPLSLRLRKLGFQIFIAVDGASGLELSRKEKPDLIILDLYLPQLSGEEVCKSVREDTDETIAKIPIIMVSAKDTAADQIVGRVIGANFYHTKPFDFSALLENMRELNIID